MESTVSLLRLYNRLRGQRVYKNKDILWSLTFDYPHLDSNHNKPLFCFGLLVRERRIFILLKFYPLAFPYLECNLECLSPDDVEFKMGKMIVHAPLSPMGGWSDAPMIQLMWYLDTKKNVLAQLRGGFRSSGFTKFLDEYSLQRRGILQ